MNPVEVYTSPPAISCRLSGCHAFRCFRAGVPRAHFRTEFRVSGPAPSRLRFYRDGGIIFNLAVTPRSFGKASSISDSGRNRTDYWLPQRGSITSRRSHCEWIAARVLSTTSQNLTSQRSGRLRWQLPLLASVAGLRPRARSFGPHPYPDCRTDAAASLRTGKLRSRTNSSERHDLTYVESLMVYACRALPGTASGHPN